MLMFKLNLRDFLNGNKLQNNIRILSQKTFGFKNHLVK